MRGAVVGEVVGAVVGVVVGVVVGEVVGEVALTGGSRSAPAVQQEPMRRSRSGSGVGRRAVMAVTGMCEQRSVPPGNRRRTGSPPRGKVGPGS